MGTERTEKPACRIRGMVRAAVILGAGLAVGVIIRFLDLYTTNLGNMFSELSVWVFLGAVIAVRSRTPFQAAGAVFGFCFGMLAAYYTTARLTHSLYSPCYGAGVVDIQPPDTAARVLCLACGRQGTHRKAPGHWDYCGHTGGSGSAL